MTSPGGEPSQGPGSPSLPGPCELCDGTGWITVEDPFLGGWLDAACPDCEDHHEHT